MMKKYILYVCFLILPFLAWGQYALEQTNHSSDTDKKTTGTSRLSTEYFNTEDYRQLGLNYRLNQRLNIQINTSGASNLTSQIMNSSLRLKYDIGKKTYLFTGIESNYENNTYSNGAYFYYSNALIGAGYQVNSNFGLEVGYQRQLIAPPEVEFRNFTNTDGFSLKAKF